MNPYGILTSYEERIKANLQRYQRPEKAGTFRLRLDHRTWTPAKSSVWHAGVVPESATRPAKATLTSPRFVTTPAGTAPWLPTCTVLSTGSMRSLCKKSLHSCFVT